MELTGYDIYDGEHVTHRTLCDRHGEALLHTTDVVYIRACEGNHTNDDACNDCENEEA